MKPEQTLPQGAFGPRERWHTLTLRFSTLTPNLTLVQATMLCISRTNLQRNESMLNGLSEWSLVSHPCGFVGIWWIRCWNKPFSWPLDQEDCWQTRSREKPCSKLHQNKDLFPSSLFTCSLYPFYAPQQSSRLVGGDTGDCSYQTVNGLKTAKNSVLVQISYIGELPLKSYQRQ